MPNTASGTAYTTTVSTQTGYGTCNLTVATAHAGDADIPTILYLHGAGGAHNQFVTHAAWVAFRDLLIDQGCAIVEGAGGLTNDSGGNNWAAPIARLAYPAYVDWAASRIDIGNLVVLGRSMGGLLAVWLYLLSPLATRISGVIVNSGVQTIGTGVVGGAPDDRPTAQRFQGAMEVAYGVTGVANVIAASHDHDPMNFDPTLWTGKNVIQLVGDKDDTVPPQTRGAYPLRPLYAGLPAIDQLDVRLGGDHTSANGSYHQVLAMSTFLTNIGFLAGEPVVAPDPTALSVDSVWMVTGRQAVTRMDLQTVPAAAKP